MNIRWFIIIAWLIIGFGCAGVRAPKERLMRTDKSFEKDLTQLREYLGEMPVELAIEGYPPQSISSLSIEVSPDSVEAIVKEAVITQIDAENTYLRRGGDNLGATIRIPTKHVTRISANGVRTQTTSEEPGPSYIFPVILGILGIASAISETTIPQGASGCKGGCLALGIILGGVAAIWLIILMLVNSSTSNQPKTVVKYQNVSKTWIIQ